MQMLPEFMRAHPGFAIPTQYSLGPDFGNTVICFHNFYGQVFPDRETDVDLNLGFFDSEGKQVAFFTQPVKTNGFLQFDTREHDIRVSGIVAVAAIPRFDLNTMNEGKVKLRAKIGTGFYVVWQDARGHADTMHEWADVRASASPSQNLRFVIDNKSSRIARHGLILTNPTLATDGAAEPSLMIYSKDRRVLGKKKMPNIPPMGSRRVEFLELFPEFHVWLSRYGSLAVQVSGRNVIEPLTMETHVSGDFHIHHIN